MVAYFKKQTWLFMLGGLAVGLLVSALCWKTALTKEPTVTRLAFVMMLALLGVVVGRILAARWCSQRLSMLSALLYDRCDPQAFLKAFGPVAAQVPRDNVAFADAQGKISFAWEGLGEFHRALAALDAVELQNIKLHSLHAAALVANQRVRVLLLQEDLPGAAAAVEKLQALEVQAKARAKMLGEQLSACLRLARTWLSFLEGGEADLEYLQEEAALAKNQIYRGEMELLCGRVCEVRGHLDRANSYYKKAAAYGIILYVGRVAAALLDRKRNGGN